MPASDTRLRPWILDQLARRGCADFTSVADIGPGDGSARAFYGPAMPHARWTGIEIWKPYVPMFGLDRLYDDLIIADVREADLPEADLYLFGDVLEHMPPGDAVKVWDRAREVSRWLVIGLPVAHYPQGPEYGNPYEAHVADWDAESVLAAFAGIEVHHGTLPGSSVGAFIARGKAARMPAAGLDLSEMTAGDAAGWPPGGDLAFDVGANEGQNLSLLTSLYRRVLALEPARESFARLVAGWGAHRQVQVFPAAVSSRDGQVALSVREAPMMSGQLVSAGMPYYGEDHGPGTPHWGQQTGLREVPCFTLGSLMAQHGIPDFVKIDTEGHEAEVLKGAAPLLAARKTAWMTEFHSRELAAECEAVFTAAGYSVQIVRHHKYPEGSEMWHSHGYLRAHPGAR